MKYFLTLFSVLSVIGCQHPQINEIVTVDVLYTNGIIWTGADDTSTSTTMATSGDQIIYVGDRSGAPTKAAATIDLNSRFVMPGFIDNHVHFIDGGFGLASVDLRDAATPEEFSKRIIDYAATLPNGNWVLSGNWDHEQWGGELPRKEWIDEGTGDTPVFVYRIDGHMALANSAALKLAGIDAQTPTPQGGEIVRDETGEPTGILKDTALEPVLSVIPKPSDDDLVEAFELAQAHALSLGLTQVNQMSAYEADILSLRAFRLAKARGLQKIRIYATTPIQRMNEVRSLIENEGRGDPMLRWDGVKGLVDGALGSTTAWFYDPYLDDASTNGFTLIAPSDLTKFIKSADQAELKVSLHGIGDQAIDEIISAMNAAAGSSIKGRRYRIEHFQHPTLEAINKISEYGIIASMQPYHAIDDGRWAEKRIGADRIKTTYAFRTILDAGALLTFGSDWPVAPLAPLDGVYAAVTRRTIDGANPDGWQKQEKISIEEALIAYTRSNAYANFEDSVAGTLEPGKRADFVILSEDPRTVPVSKIPAIKILTTIINGETVFHRKE